MEIFKRIKSIFFKSEVKSLQLKLLKLEIASKRLIQYTDLLYKDKPNLLKYLSEEGEVITSLKKEEFKSLKSDTLDFNYDNLQASWTEILVYLAMIPSFDQVNQSSFDKMILQVNKDLIQFNEQLNMEIKKVI